MEIAVGLRHFGENGVALASKNVLKIKLFDAENPPVFFLFILLLLLLATGNVKRLRLSLEE